MSDRPSSSHGRPPAPSSAPASRTPSSPPSKRNAERSSDDRDRRYQELVPVRHESLLVHRRLVRDRRREQAARDRRRVPTSSSDRYSCMLDEMCRSAPSRAAASSLLHTSSLLSARAGGSRGHLDAALSMELLRRMQLDQDGDGLWDDEAASADWNVGEVENGGEDRVSWRDAYRGEGEKGFELSAGEVADAFFDEYPDCIASDYDDSSSTTSSDDEEDGDDRGETTGASTKATSNDVTRRANPQHASRQMDQPMGPNGEMGAATAHGGHDGRGPVAGHPNGRDSVQAPARGSNLSGLTQESRFDYDGGDRDGGGHGRGRGRNKASQIGNPYGGPRPTSAEDRGQNLRSGRGRGDGVDDNPYRHDSWEDHDRSSRVVRARGAPDQQNGYHPPPRQRQQQQRPHQHQQQQRQQRWQQQEQQQHNPYHQQQQNPYQQRPPQKPNPFRTASEYARGGGGADDVDSDGDDNGRDDWGGFRDGGGPHGAATAPAPAPPPAPAPAPVPRGGPTLSAGLKRKFQPPKKGAARRTTSGGTGSGNGGGSTAAHRPSSSHSRDGANNEDDDLPEELRGLDKELVDKITNEILHSGDPVTFEDIAGLEDAKQTVLELVCWPMKRPDLFTGLRRGPNGLLLFGPPGTGKTLIGKAIAHESGATFFSISSSSLTSKWIGEGEKLVRTLFAVAAVNEPAVVFIDEIDSLLTQRKADENEASRRIKTEFLVQLDGTGTSGRGRVLVIGATNRPHELDDAARRRFVKRLYIPLPAKTDRNQLLHTLLRTNRHSLNEHDMDRLSNDTDGFSGADLKALCTDAALGPIRQLGKRALTVDPADVPPISYKHFRKALRGMNPSVAPADLKVYLEWNAVYGSKSAAEGGDLTNDSDDEED